MRLTLGLTIIAIFVFVLLAFLPVSIAVGTAMYLTSSYTQPLLWIALPVGVALAWLVSLAILVWEYRS